MLSEYTQMKADVTRGNRFNTELRASLAAKGKELANTLHAVKDPRLIQTLGTFFFVSVELQSSLLPHGTVREAHGT